MLKSKDNTVNARIQKNYADDSVIINSGSLVIDNKWVDYTGTFFNVKGHLRSLINAQRTRFFNYANYAAYLMIGIDITGSLTVVEGTQVPFTTLKSVPMPLDFNIVPLVGIVVIQDGSINLIDGIKPLNDNSVIFYSGMGNILDKNIVGQRGYDSLINGETGAQGETGLRGVPGLIGSKGNIGDIGYDGIGVTGPIGDQGMTGINWDIHIKFDTLMPYILPITTTTPAPTTTTPPPPVGTYFTFGEDESYEPKLYRSNDLITWNDLSDALPNAEYQWVNRVVYGKDVLVCFSLGVFYSLDKGASWQEASLPGMEVDEYPYRVDFCEDRFFMLVHGPYLDGGWFVIYQSLDGMTWTRGNKFADRWPLWSYLKFIYFKGNYCAVGYLGDHGDPPTVNSVFLQMTIDNVWTDTNIDIPYLYASDCSVAVSDSYIVVLSSNKDAYFSEDGLSWTKILVGAEQFSAVFHFDQYFYFLKYDVNPLVILGIRANDDYLVEDLASEYGWGDFIFPGQTIIVNETYYAVNYLSFYYGPHYFEQGNLIYHNSIPNIFTMWESSSSGIPEGVELHQLLG
jgi:hypothetical protein